MFQLVVSEGKKKHSMDSIILYYIILYYIAYSTSSIMVEVSAAGGLVKLLIQHGLNIHAPYWPCAGGLSAVNAIGTQLRDPINSALTRWRMAVLKK